ncbi:hypothetical protein GCM10009753_33220 [Streptantibioticus ferralitis]
MQLRSRVPMRMPVGRPVPMRRLLRLTRAGTLHERCGPSHPAGATPFMNDELAGAEGYFFLPWFFTASIAAFAASGSR